MMDAMVRWHVVRQFSRRLADAYLGKRSSRQEQVDSILPSLMFWMHTLILLRVGPVEISYSS